MPKPKIIEGPLFKKADKSSGLGSGESAPWMPPDVDCPDPLGYLHNTNKKGK